MTRLVSKEEMPVVTTSSAMMHFFTRLDGKALQGHHVVHALGEDGALAQLAAQLVGVHDAAHGRSHDHVHVQVFQLLGHVLHDQGAFVGYCCRKAIWQ